MKKRILSFLGVLAVVALVMRVGTYSEEPSAPKPKVVDRAVRVAPVASIPVKSTPKVKRYPPRALDFSKNPGEVVKKEASREIERRTGLSGRLISEGLSAGKKRKKVER